MPAAVNTVDQYLASLPAERRAIVEAIRNVVRANLDADYDEGIQYGMIGYYVPHRVYPAGYHTDPKQPLPFAALASQKSHVALYLMGLYVDATGEPDGETDDARWFRGAWTATGRKLDMGRSCVRVRALADVPLEVVGEAIRRVPAATFVARYERARAKTAPAKKASAKKATPAKPARTKTA